MTMHDYIMISVSILMMIVGASCAFLTLCSIILTFTTTGKKQETSMQGGLVCFVFACAVLSGAALAWPT